MSSPVFSQRPRLPLFMESASRLGPPTLSQILDAGGSGSEGLHGVFGKGTGLG